MNNDFKPILKITGIVAKYFYIVAIFNDSPGFGLDASPDLVPCGALMPDGYAN